MIKTGYIDLYTCNLMPKFLIELHLDFGVLVQLLKRVYINKSFGLV